MKKIGFIGLGHMGHPMVNNLLKSDYEVHVYDISKQAVESSVKDGAKAADSLAYLAKNMDAVISMVQTGEQVKSLCLSEEGLFTYARKNLLYIDCSSIDIVATRELHLLADESDIEMLDAPVSGGVAGAATGALTIMVGGDEKIFNRAKEILSSVGKKIIYAGNAGSGQAAKICNNLLLAISMIGVSEAFTLAKKLGLDPKKFFEISSNASGQCWSMTSYCPEPGIIDNVPSNKNYEPGFMSKMMLKDLRLAQHAAEAANAVIPLGAVTTELYDLFVQQGMGEMDFSGIIKLVAGEM